MLRFDQLACSLLRVFGHCSPDEGVWNVKQEDKMIKNLRTRRTVAAIMVVLGAILMLIAPEIWAGLLLLILGVVLELAGIALAHKAKKAP
jgi:hypothetical protein